MTIILSHSKENPELPWRLEVDGAHIFCSEVFIQVPSKTLIREGGAPQYVLEADGDLYMGEDQKATIT
jgi:hypothetical protein